MSCLSAFIATGLADKSGTMTARDVEVIVSTNVSTLRVFSLSLDLVEHVIELNDT